MLRVNKYDTSSFILKYINGSLLSNLHKTKGLLINMCCMLHGHGTYFGRPFAVTHHLCFCGVVGDVTLFTFGCRFCLLSRFNFSKLSLDIFR